MADARKLVAVRLNPNGLVQVDRLAVAAGTTRSDMIRVLLGEALAARSGREARPVPKEGVR